MTALPTLARYSRASFGAGERFTRIGEGPVGGKAAGLLRILERVGSDFPDGRFGPFEVTVPSFTVVAADWFETFLEENGLPGALAGLRDDEIAMAFQRANLPVGLVGDLRALMEDVRAPLALRSSSLLEDALEHPFAGVYGTKMTPNDQIDADTRFTRVVEAIKFVWASTFFSAARAYRARVGAGESERMAILVQEVVGRRHEGRHYPDVSGVARSLAFYRFGGTAPEEGIAQLALGLGRTIVQGEPAWTFCPARPKATPPYRSTGELLRETQTRFWAVRMGEPPEYDPARETEHLVHASLADAESDGTLSLTASTLDPRSERLAPGLGRAGPRVLTFAPLLVLDELPLAALIRKLLLLTGDAMGGPVELEFAVTLPGAGGAAPRFCVLQARRMAVSSESVDLTAERSGWVPLVSSDHVLGNGVIEGIADVVYLVPERFDAGKSHAMAAEIASLNRHLLDEGRPYLLIGFGRWGSADPWLGVPVNWGDVSGARVLVETSPPGHPIEMSQGSHFIHNLAAFSVPYVCVPEGGQAIDWEWLRARPVAFETAFVRHVRLEAPLLVEVDGRVGKGAVLRRADEVGPP
ncbi:MAG TPA: PEP/pyruvate-binding domain-containing protein [Thermoanaerobaculia bacterium]